MSQPKMSSFEGIAVRGTGAHVGEQLRHIHHRARVPISDVPVRVVHRCLVGAPRIHGGLYLVVPTSPPCRRLKCSAPTMAQMSAAESDPAWVLPLVKVTILRLVLPLATAKVTAKVPATAQESAAETTSAKVPGTAEEKAPTSATLWARRTTTRLELIASPLEMHRIHCVRRGSVESANPHAGDLNIAASR